MENKMDFNIFLRRYKFLLFRLKDAAKQSASNPRDEVSGIATASQLCPKGNTLFD